MSLRVGRRGLFATLALLALVLVALKGCYVPPVVMQAGIPVLDLEGYPTGTQRLDLPVRTDDGETVLLRGVAWPPPPGGPVLLHLLESKSSVTTGARGMGGFRINGDPEGAIVDAGGLGVRLSDGYPPESPHGPLRLQQRWFARLAALGWGGVAVDYEGVGASEGERDPDTLRRDARAAWDEALRLAEGDASRVILRGSSIGTLAAATLLEDGARPAAAVLVAPVRAETVAINFGRKAWNPVLLWFAQWFVRDAMDVDLTDVLARCEVPLLVVVPQDDWLMPPDEAALVGDAVGRAGGTFLVRRVGHEGLAISSRDLLAVELVFLQRHLPGLLPPRLPRALAAWERARETGRADGQPADAFAEGSAALERLRVILEQVVLPSDELSLAAALSGLREEEFGQAADWVSWLPAERLDVLTVDELVLLLDLSDPEGRVDIERIGDASWGTGAVSDLDLDGLLALYDEFVRAGVFREMSGSFGATGLVTGVVSDVVTTNSLLAWKRRLIEAGSAPVDADRLALRALLKIGGVPDRVLVDADGRRVLEALHDGAWREIETR